MKKTKKKYKFLSFFITFPHYYYCFWWKAGIILPVRMRHLKCNTLIVPFSLFSIPTDDVNMNSTQGFGTVSCIITEPESPPQKIRFRVKPVNQLQSTSNALQQSQHGNLVAQKTTRSSVANANNNNKVSVSGGNAVTPNFLSNQLASQQQRPQPNPDSLLVQNANTETITTESTTPSSRQPQRRRVRRKANSPSDDQAEHLTEMSVRGLDLFRYAKIFDGIYQCTECAKENIQKTFKNKYSFQRHAFLYHEGTQRKVFPCPVCSKEFSRPDKMKNHMKTTHECYMPKDSSVYPLNFLAGSGGDMPAGGATADVAPHKSSAKKSKANNANDTAAQPQKGDTLLTRLQASSDSHIKIDSVMSQYNAQIQANTPLIKVETASD